LAYLLNCAKQTAKCTKKITVLRMKRCFNNKCGIDYGSSVTIINGFWIRALGFGVTDRMTSAQVNFFI
jgi:hypothetical protein